MAKKKTKKSDVNKGKVNYRAELIGFLFILVGVIGLGKFGVVGKVVKSFAIFLTGSWYVILFCGLLALGAYMIIKAKRPAFLSQRMIGAYFIFLSLLILSHQNYLIDNKDDILNVFSLTIDNFFAAIDSIKISSLTDVVDGGGIIGAFFSVIFYKLFCDGTNLTGLYVVVGALVIFGIVGLFNVSPLTIAKSPYYLFKKLFIKEEIDDEEEDKPLKKNKKQEKIKDKVVISNINEVTQVIDEPKEEEKKEEVKKLINMEGYQLPPLSMLDAPKKKGNSIDKNEIEEKAKKIEQVLKDFDIKGSVVEVHVGPNITQYEVEVEAGTKVSKVTNISREMALELASKDVRIQPISGKRTIGIEVPNKEITPVTAREVLEQIPSKYDSNKLVAALGKDIMGTPIFVEVNATPHMLIAGSTGSGKSVCINGIITSVLMRAKPDEVKMILIDPKKVEFTVYKDVPHLVTPVVTDPKEANVALKKVVQEMDKRYDDFARSGTKNIAGYNAFLEKKNKTLPKDEQVPYLPYWLVVVDELADLMMVASKDVEASITRITQLARAAGIHLIVATQRPSTDVITGIIKANIPTRISFAVSSGIDSRTILDSVGAEKLLGKGDMLFIPVGENTPIRLQGNYLSEEEIARVVAFVKEQQQPQFSESFQTLANEEQALSTADGGEEGDDPLYNEIVEFVITTGKVSASLLQRRFRLGYNRAARIVDLLEERGIVGPQNGSKPREVLVKLEENEEE